MIRYISLELSTSVLVFDVSNIFIQYLKKYYLVLVSNYFQNSLCAITIV